MPRKINLNRPELPRTDLIEACDAQSALIESNRAAQTETARALLNQAPRKRASEAVAKAAAHLTDAELDSAWRAALRGDQAVVEARILPHVDARSTRRRRATTPWRASGWLKKR